jgi:hypothetical protein
MLRFMLAMVAISAFKLNFPIICPSMALKRLRSRRPAVRHALLTVAMAFSAVASAHARMTASVGHSSTHATPSGTNLTGVWTSSEGAALVIHRQARWDTAAVAFVAGRLVAAAGAEYEPRTQCTNLDDSGYSFEPGCQHWDTTLASFSLYDRTSAPAEDVELPSFSHGELVAMRLQGFLEWLRKRSGAGFAVVWVNFESCVEDDVEEHVRRVLPMGSKGVHISPYGRSNLRRLSGMRSVLAYPCGRTPCTVFPDGPRRVRLVHQENTLHCVSERPLLVGSVGGVQHAAMVLPEEMRGLHRENLLIIRCAVDRGSLLAVLLQSKLPRRLILLVPKYRDSFLFLGLLLNLLMASVSERTLVPGTSWKSLSFSSLREGA